MAYLILKSFDVVSGSLQRKPACYNARTEEGIEKHTFDGDREIEAYSLKELAEEIVK